MNVTDVRTRGEEKPDHIAQPDAFDLYSNMKQVEFLKQVKDDLYRQAIKKNKINYNY